MDWQAAIEWNRQALQRVLAALVVMAGPMADPTLGAKAGALPRRLHRAVLRLLRPAEAATRRLVIAAARGLSVTLPAARPRGPEAGRPPSVGRSGLPVPPGTGSSAAPRRLCLALVDPLPSFTHGRRRASAGVPRISAPGITRPFAIATRPPPSPDDPIDAARLALRLAALGRVLDDLPAQARRFARWRFRAAAGAQKRETYAAAGARDGNRRAGRHRRIWPLRPGRPPGARRRPDHDVHRILGNTHGLALWALSGRPDTS